ncbi:hypothetical protein BC938DRAFT_480115 [Jimgerdemannia flammicorona]|uniref:Uncharacterized protein n=1 Tax=Jimgerdemannia flammicorona TaxID=994334 RepID=A0A433QJD0_9FUNG|nr:hypothetical protein BC938DRAFT_480115 [Jimgerdemannia flammicorona]
MDERESERWWWRTLWDYGSVHVSEVRLLVTGNRLPTSNSVPPTFKLQPPEHTTTPISLAPSHLKPLLPLQDNLHNYTYNEMETLLAPPSVQQPTQNGNAFRELPIFRNNQINSKSPSVARKTNIAVAGKDIPILKARVSTLDKPVYVFRRMDTDYVNARWKMVGNGNKEQGLRRILFDFPGTMAHLRKDSRTVVLEGGRGSKQLVAGTWYCVALTANPVPLHWRMIIFQTFLGVWWLGYPDRAPIFNLSCSVMLCHAFQIAKRLAREYGVDQAFSLLLNAKNPHFPNNDMDDMENTVTESESVASLEVASISNPINDEDAKVPQAEPEDTIVVARDVDVDGDVSIQEKEVITVSVSVTTTEVATAMVTETPGRKRKLDDVEAEEAEAEGSSSYDVDGQDAKKAKSVKSVPEAGRDSKRLRWLGFAAAAVVASVASASLYALDSLPFL